jgi:hypothetical protein
LLARLDDPGTVAALTALVDNIATLSALLGMASGFLGRSPEVMDNVRSAVREVRGEASEQAGIVSEWPHLAKVGRQSVGLAARLADDDAIANLGRSRALDPDFLGALFAFLDEARGVQIEMAGEAPHRRRSILRLPIMMRDRDFNRGIDFVLRLVTALGKAIGPPGGVGASRRGDMAEGKGG